MEDSKKNNSNEIDLSDLIKRVFNFFLHAIFALFNYFLKVFSYLTVYGLRNWKPMTIFLVIGMGYGLFNFYSGEKAVLSDMLIRNNETSNSEMISKINNLKIYAEQGSYALLAQKLNVDEASAKSIHSIGAYWLIDSDYDGVADYVDYKNTFNQLEDTTLRRLPNLIDIRVKTTTPLVLSTLKDGIQYFLLNDSELKKLNETRINGITNLISKIEIEGAELDKLQDYEYFYKNKENNLDLGNLGKLRLSGEEKDTRLLHEDVLSLEKQRLEYEKELAVNGSIMTIIKDFAVNDKPEKSLLFLMFYYGVIVLMIGYSILFLLCHRKRIIAFLEEKSK